MDAAWILGHQGGWDEILVVLAPIALFAGLLVMANRRAGRDTDRHDPPAGTRAPGRTSSGG